jgi:hypothetical protein
LANSVEAINKKKEELSASNENSKKIFLQQKEKIADLQRKLDRSENEKVASAKNYLSAKTEISELKKEISLQQSK